MELVADVVIYPVVVARQDVHHVALVLVNVSWRARPGSQHVDEERMVVLAAAQVKVNASADLSL